jgi:hypothetical protein
MSKRVKLPWQKWYWDEWFTSVDVQSLPRDTRMVWFEMLGRMWNSSERGFLTINGKPMNDGALSALLGFNTDIEQFKKHLGVIESAGLFSRRESDNAIFSRKMLNDQDLYEKKAAAGRHGGLVTQKQKAVVLEPDESEALGYPGELTEDEKLRANELALAGASR